MCDTQVQVGPDAVWFAKNSDREPSEPQPVVRVDAVRGDAAPLVRATYIEVPQVPDRHAVLLSRPVWCWGAEMGVNQHGVAIGNEAIFSTRRSTQPALLGMDLVRLGLERGASAAEALDVMTGLLARHGQGGPAGFHDKSFCYDSSFLIADPREAWVLETAGREWAARRVDRCYAISNQLTLGRERDRASPALPADADFARRFDTRFMPFFARSAQRRALSLSHLTRGAPPSLARLAFQLRAHQGDGEDPAAGSNGDVCMHAHGFIRRHQTTGSMIARLAPGGPTVLFTGTSAPCLSIFRPAGFEGDFSVLTPPGREVEALLWRRHEFLHRRALADAGLRGRLRATRDEIERKVFAELAADAPPPEALARADRLAAAWHKVLWESLPQTRAAPASRFWARVSAADGIL
jgi:secernin